MKALLSLFTILFILFVSIQTMAANDLRDVSCDDPISFSLNFEEIEWSSSSNMSGIIIGTKSSFSYDIVKPVSLKGSGEVAMEELSVVDHSFEYTLEGSFYFEGWVNYAGKEEYVKVWTNQGIIQLKGKSFTTDPGVTITMFSDDENSSSGSSSGPLLPKYKFSGTTLAWLECCEFEVVAKSECSCSFNFDQMDNFTSSHMSSEHFLCDDAIAVTGLVPNSIELVNNDTTLEFNSDNYTLECPVAEGTILGALLDFQIPEKVISRGVVSRFYGVADVDECTLKDMSGNEVSWDGTSMATPALF